MKYTKLQYLLWLISGSEISTLKDCPEDYNRHANVGMMILITSLFASGTAFVAGITFAKTNLIGVLSFSFVWGVLIFVLDRSMVNSIKRDPDVTVQPFWLYFVPRFLLALILAFFMSVPLDHIVFPEAIEHQMKEDKNASWLKRKADLNAGFSVVQREDEITKLGQELKEINEELKSDCPRSDYIKAQDDYKNSIPKIKNLETAYANKLEARREYYRRMQVAQDTIYPRADATYRKLNEECNTAKQAVKDQRTESESFKKEAIRIEKEWRDGLVNRQSKKDSIYTASEKELGQVKDSVEIKAEEYRKEEEGMVGFDTKFATLFLMPNWGIQVLKWAIFLALLVIEILPTYLKLKTPIGEYDVELYKKEKSHRSRAIHYITAEDDIARESEKYRKEKEIELNKTVNDRMAEIELKLAKQSLDEWETEALVQIKISKSSGKTSN